MKVKYTFPIEPSIRLQDHWPVPLLGGMATLIESDGLIVAIQFEKAGCSTDLAFQIQEIPDQISKATISGNDSFAFEVRDYLERAFSYLQCYFNTSIKTDEIDIVHISESDAEKELIQIPTFKIGKNEPEPLNFGFDMLTRALMAADNSDTPFFSCNVGSKR